MGLGALARRTEWLQVRRVFLKLLQVNVDLNRGSSLCCRWRYFEKGGEIPGGLSRERWLTCVPRDPVINGGRRAGRCGAGSFPTGGA